MSTVRIGTVDGQRIGADLAIFPWCHPQMEAGIDFEIDPGSSVNGGGLMLRCPALGIHIGGDTARALLGQDHPAIRTSRDETELILRARSRTNRRIDRRRMIDRDRGRS